MNEQGRGNKSPLSVGMFFAVFFIALGFYARFFTEEPHPLYAAGAWILALMWLGLAWVSRKGTR